MPSAERPEFYPRRERQGDIPPFHQAARFSGEEAAGQAYFAAEELIYSRPDIDLSTFRFLTTHNPVWHVLVLGLTPREDVQAEIGRILAAGELVELPEDALQRFAQRRRQSIGHGRPWSEGHHRPGTPL